MTPRRRPCSSCRIGRFPKFEWEEARIESPKGLGEVERVIPNLTHPADKKKMRLPSLMICLMTLLAGAASAAVKPDDIRGVRTKWQFVAGDDVRHSIEPDRFGLSLRDWIVALEGADVNAADLNLEPSSKLRQNPQISDDEVKSYITAVESAPKNSARNSADVVSRFKTTIVPQHQYTSSQRDEILLSFLSQVDQLKASGSIKGSIRFFLHQRLWFRPGAAADRVALRSQRVEEFSRDMANFINKARDRHLDQWIAGIRLGENDNNQMDEFLPVLLGVAHEVNSITSGWLKANAFIANGGGMGADFTGIEAADPEFFAKIAVDTGSFAFGYKWMEREGDNSQIKSIMGTSACANGRQCDVHSASDWQYYLGRIGFDDLVSFIDKNHVRYPDHANVVFIGDSSDSVTLMVQNAERGDLQDGAPLKALRALWPKDRSGWRGKMFMNGFINSQVLESATNSRTADVGRALFFAGSGTRPTALSNTFRIWRQWP